MAAYWLVKSEPAKYAYADLERDGKTVWDGVRNNAAALHLKAMKVGDQVLYYHSQVKLSHCLSTRPWPWSAWPRSLARRFRTRPMPQAGSWRWS